MKQAPDLPITIRDVACLAGVSVATVSRVLNDSAHVSRSTRDSVLRAVNHLGYRPNANAQALASQVSDTIGVVVTDVSDPFFGALVKAVDLVAQQHNKYLLIGNSYHQEDKERNAIEVLLRQRCDALIVHSKALSDPELIHFLQTTPGMVLINRVIAGYETRCVWLDNFHGAVMATRLLMQRGHQRIGYLGSSHGIEDNTDRQAGWQCALGDAGIQASERWIALGTPDMQGGEAAMIELLGRNLQLSAIFSYNDSMALGALAALKDNGISVPEHLSMIGFDDIPVACYSAPQLTTIRYPIASMARLAAELALQAASRHQQSPGAHCFMPTLVQRHSVAIR